MWDKKYSPPQVKPLFNSSSFLNTPLHTHQVYGAEILEGEDYRELRSKNNYCPTGMFELVAMLLEVWPLKYQKRSGFLSHKTFQGAQKLPENLQNYEIRWAGNFVCSRINHKHETVQICIAQRSNIYFLLSQENKQKYAECKKSEKRGRPFFHRVWSEPANWSMRGWAQDDVTWTRKCRAELSSTCLRVALLSSSRNKIV